MLTASCETLVQVLGGEIIAGSADVVGNDVFIDSRAVAPGGVFIALPGEHVDGHECIPDAIANGARVLIVTRSAEQVAPVVSAPSDREVTVIRVSDGLAALQALASYHRSRLHCEVVGVTGSTGKTSTKDFLGAVLSASFRTVLTQGNRNNEVGVPLTVLAAGADTDVLVVEMGMRGAGQIARLCEIARPTMGLLTNVGTSHIEILGSQDAVADAKGELIAAIPSEGAVFLNGDDAYSARLAERAAAPVVRYGLGETADVRALDVSVDPESHPTFSVVAGAERFEVTLGVPGRHNVYNALAASAVALRLGMTPDEIAAALSGAELSAMRMQVFTTAGGIVVVNDAYNANPVSMRAAVETLADMTAGERRIAVLGDMAELGSLTELAHFRIGEAIATLPIDQLVTVGPRAKRIAEGAAAAGMAADRVRACVTPAEASEVLDDLLAPGDIVLVKASRVMGLEAIVEGIVHPRV